MIGLYILGSIVYMVFGAILGGLELKYEGIFISDIKDEKAIVGFYIFVWPFFVVLLIIYTILKHPCRLLHRLAKSVAES